ncbi:MAG: hypothetical protein LBD88_00145 [Candidatus Peribacteria bacterium]|nr:hypothetical protein [Candidatus Peribacteria bacterium]
MAISCQIFHEVEAHHSFVLGLSRVTIIVNCGSSIGQNPANDPIVEPIQVSYCHLYAICAVPDFNANLYHSTCPPSVSHCPL